MDLSAAEFQYDSEDVISLATAQAFGLLLAAAAVLITGSHYVGVAGEYTPFQIPYAGWIGPVTAVIALAGAVALPNRFSRVWKDARGRKRIFAGLLQMSVTAVIAAMLGYYLAGGRIDLATPNQLLLIWLSYGLATGGVLHLLIALVAFGFLILGQELPDFVD